MSRASAILRIIAAVFIMTLGSVGTSVAQGDNRPHTEPVLGEFSAAPVNAMQRRCEGQDGEYLEIRGRFAGVIESSDPRLSGELEFLAEPALVNVDTGFGTFRGRFTIRDLVTGRQTAEGEFHNVVTNVGLNHGFALGKVMGDRGAADDFFATFNALLDLDLNVTGAFGSVGDARKPAVIQGGHCTGPFTRVP